MSISVKKIIATSLVSALVLGPVFTVGFVLTTNAADATLEGYSTVNYNSPANAFGCYDGAGAYICEEPTIQADLDAATTEYEAVLYTDADVELQDAFDLAFSSIDAEELGKPTLEYFHNYLSFGGFGTTSAADSEAVQGGLIDSDIGDSSLTF